MEYMSVSSAAVAVVLLPLMTMQAQDAPKPPQAPTHDHQEMRHGVAVVDPYFWLREKSNPDVAAYLNRENAYTEAMTAGLKPLETELYGEMLGRIKQTDLEVPVRRGDYLYYTRTEEGKQYPIRCRRKGSMEAPEQVVLDPNEMEKEHKFVGIGAVVYSDDGNLMAYTVDFTGFRQYALHVKDLRNGTTLPDTTERVTSVEWAADNRTVFLGTEDAVTKRSDKIWRHVLGSPTFEPVYEEPDELYDIGVTKTRDKQYLLIEIESKDTTEWRYLRSAQPDGAFATFLPRRKQHRYYVDHREGLFYIRTNRDGVNFSIATAPEQNPSEKNWQVWLPHREHVLVEDLELFQDFAVSIEKSDAVNQLRVYRFAGESWAPIAFPEQVYSAFPSENPEYSSTTFRYSYQSFVTPPSVYDYDVSTGKSTLRKQQEVLGGYDPSRYVSERLWATARDGTKVPVSIVYKKGFARDGKGPLLLYGYGSYGIGMSATFSSSRLSLLDRGMAFAIAHIRGGDDMGWQWRLDGMLRKKKNTFYDFIDTAEYLVNQHWTSKDKLVIEGGSAGGLLIGACVNFRPDLFRAAHLAVPFVDVMNTMMDASLPLTVGEYLEWGNPNEQPAYEYMNTYSPYDNLRKRSYPAILVTTSFNDSQVMYWEPAKYVARLRTVKTDTNPLLLKIKMEPAGHGGASGRYDRLHDQAFEYAWMLSQVGINN
jgi:oligopeptidase B